MHSRIIHHILQAKLEQNLWVFTFSREEKSARTCVSHEDTKKITLSVVRPSQSLKFRNRLVGWSVIHSFPK